jgi:hypothetical protein
MSNASNASVSSLSRRGLVAAILGTAGSEVFAQQSNASNPTPTGASLDSSLYTTFRADQNYQNLSLVTCGSLPGTEGCYGSATIGPFNRIGAVIEGGSSTIGDTVTRDVYVLDVAGGESGNAVTLYIWKMSNTIDGGFDQVGVKFDKAIPLPQLVGGSLALGFMAGNGGFLVMGTDQSLSAVILNKSKGTLSEVGGFSPPLNVVSITADANDYITVTQGNGEFTGFSVVGPAGTVLEDGGGAPFMLNTRTGITPAALFPSNSAVRPGVQSNAKYVAPVSVP